MPLDAEHYGCTDPALQSFDHPVFRGPRHPDEVVSYVLNGLMMAGVDRQPPKNAVRGGLGGTEQPRKEAFSLYLHRMRYGHPTARGVIYGNGQQILRQGTTAPDIQQLQAETDGQKGFSGCGRVRKQTPIAGFPGRVAGRSCGMASLPVARWRDIGGAAGQNETVQAFEFGFQESGIG